LQERRALFAGDDLLLLDQITATELFHERDELFAEAVRVVQEAGRGSVGLLQRKLRLGYGRAARLIDRLEESGLLGPELGGALGREVLLLGNNWQLGRDVSPLSEEDQPTSAKPRVWM
jgi:S-DNA-T family DNA segregation ATPase FtsK/SpoIIIE